MQFLVHKCFYIERAVWKNECLVPIFLPNKENKILPHLLYYVSANNASLMVALCCIVFLLLIKIYWVKQCFIVLCKILKHGLITAFNGIQYKPHVTVSCPFFSVQQNVLMLYFLLGFSFQLLFIQMKSNDPYLKC